MVLYHSFSYKGNNTFYQVGCTGVSNAGLVQKKGISVPLPKSDGQSNVKKTWETLFTQKLRFAEKKRYLPMGVRIELGLVNPEKTTTTDADHKPNGKKSFDQCKKALNTKALSDGQSNVKKTWEALFTQKLRFPEKKRYLPMGVRVELGLVNPEKIATTDAIHRPNGTNSSDQCKKALNAKALNAKALSANKSDNLKPVNATLTKEIDKENSHTAENNYSNLTNADNFEEYARKQLEELDEFLKTVDGILTENNAKPIVYKDMPVDALLEEIDEVLKINEVSLGDSVNDTRMAKLATKINANVSDLFPSVSQKKITFSNTASQAKDLLEDVIESSSRESLDSTDSNNSNIECSTVQRKRKRDVTNLCFSDCHEKKRKFVCEAVKSDHDKKKSPAILLGTNFNIQQPIRLIGKRAAPKGEETLPKKRKFSFIPVSFP
ncbi:hypothetical protein DPMN_048219 [Dreissena polymorpha]|uniref:Uncharacterized protein n=1 Tax=Dreissena polymorpha TaxID=45954 RepID=A0A9D4DB86_DREPO|nr:hypothetical protein DPMN_048219 [Dreissena polymorpha]